MAKATRTASAEPLRPLTSDELRRAALSRSARRGAGVASRRVARRWVLWSVGQVLKWISLPVLAAAGGYYWWLQQAAPRPTPAPAPARPPPLAASMPPQPAASMQLRLDRADAQSPSSSATTDHQRER